MSVDQQKLAQAQQYWDGEAATFDQEPDHGLADDKTRAAWRSLLTEHLPTPPATILDIGCGTGSLTLLLAEQDYELTGIDLSTAMIEQAQRKLNTAGYSVPLRVMNAADPHLPGQQFDTIVCRHLLWALPDPAQVLARWSALLKPGGYLLLVEGHWHTGGGLHASKIVDLLPARYIDVQVTDLSGEAILWGQVVEDERS